MAGAVVVAAGLAAGLTLGTGGGGSPVPVRPSAFQVVYKVVTTASARWEVLSESGPFDVSDLTYDNDPRTGTSPASGTVTTFDGLYSLDRGRLILASDRQPALGSGDQALVPELGDLQARGLAVRLGPARRVAGASCSVYRFSEPPAGPLTAVTGADHDDLCLSSSGLELAETWTYGGRVVLQRTAVEVTPGGADQTIHGAPSPSGGPPAASVVRVGPASRQALIAAPPLPGGFTPSAPVGVAAYDPTNGTQLVDSSTLWAFRRGGDVVTVEAGEGQTPWDDSGSPVGSLRLPGLGAAQSLLRSDGPEIQVQLPDNRWVRVDGTVPLSYLTAYAGRLRPA